MDATIVILAAGIGNRYGGAKQITPVGPCGEKIIDFSMYDAYKAGFKKVVFIIRKSLEKDFREEIGDPVSKFMETDYVFQEIAPEYAGQGRVKPLGTAEAIALCRGHVNEPFAVINADDYYGCHAFTLIKKCLDEMTGKNQYAMMGYRIENTVTDKGSVARGVCRTENGMLTEINERTHVEKRGNGAAFTQSNVVFARTAVIGVSLNDNVLFRVRLQPFGLRFQDIAGFFVQVRFIETEENAVFGVLNKVLILFGGFSGRADRRHGRRFFVNGVRGSASGNQSHRSQNGN